MNRDEIEEIKDKIRDYTAEIVLNDEILQRLYVKLAEDICTNLTTLWFYHDALSKRIGNN